MDSKELKQWSNKLHEFIYLMLVPLIKDNEVKLAFVNEDAMKIWISAFTHESFAPNSSYEELEYFGDRVLKYVFSRYLLIRFPECSNSNYTNLDAVYMSKSRQPGYAKKLGLDKFILFVGPSETPPTILEDVFESFFGALDIIGNNITPGLGTVVAYNLIFDLFSDERFKQYEATTAPITQVSHIFDKFFGKDSIKDLAVSKKEKNGKWTYEVHLSEEMIDYIEIDEIPQDGIIGKHTASTEAGAKNTAYSKALKLLHNSGITEEWANIQKREEDLYGEEDKDGNENPLAKEATKAREKYRDYTGDEEAEIEIKISNLWKSKGLEVLLLYGILDPEDDDTDPFCYTYRKTLLYYVEIGGFLDEKGSQKNKIKNNEKRESAKKDLLKKYNRNGIIKPKFNMLES